MLGEVCCVSVEEGPRITTEDFMIFVDTSK